MKRFSTIDPPAAMSYFTANFESASTTIWSGVSLIEQRIRSAFEGAVRELLRYEKYPMLWDGYRAEPFADEVLDDAGKILRYSEVLFLDAGVIPQLVTTGPASDGSIDLELQVGDRRVLMTLYPKDDNLRLSSFQRDEIREYVAPLGTKVVGEWLAWLHQPKAIPPVMDENPSRT